ncbi:hypothetical protein WL90_31505 [Burkholderia cenocepacia]|nr:hypothetical protein WL90_31505 [Burkholderia cenocepacia]KWF67081.1 hypothetical protein WL89_08775 [Burkholderia cenocepacia]
MNFSNIVDHSEIGVFLKQDIPFGDVGIDVARFFINCVVEKLDGIEEIIRDRIGGFFRGKSKQKIVWIMMTYPVYEIRILD